MQIEECAFVKSVTTWESGGGIEVDLIELEDGKVLMVSEEAVVAYENMDAAQSGRPIEGLPFIPV